MSKSIIHNPHDKLVRRLLANVNTAREILEAYLPERVKELIDLNDLKRQPDSFVDAQHRFLEVDILFKARCKTTHEDCHIWVLVEQQRQPDVWLPLRLFCYLGVIWDHIRKASKTRAKSAKLPFIYPLIISNASTPYRHSLTLRDMIEPEEAKPLFDELFSTPSHLLDLAAIPDEELRTQLQGNVGAQSLLLSLKHVFDKNLQEYLETVLLTLLQTLEQEGHKDEVVDLLYYLYNEGNLNDSSKFWTFLDRQFSKNVEDKMLTLGQRAIQEAVQEAVQEAEQRAKQQAVQQAKDTALRMLNEKLDIQLISRMTNLSPQEIRQLKKKS